MVIYFGIWCHVLWFFTFSFFLWYVVTAPSNKVTWIYGAIQMLLLLLYYYLPTESVAVCEYKPPHDLEDVLF